MNARRGPRRSRLTVTRSDHEYVCLCSQLTELTERLERTQDQLNRLRRIDTALHTRFASRIEGLVREQRAALEELRTELEAGRQAGGLQDDAWRDFRTIRVHCSRLFRDISSVLQAAIFREHLQERELFEFAEGLLDRLSVRSDLPWGGVVVPGEVGSYSDVTRIIRLAYPQVGVWRMPEVGHELGHFVAPRLAYNVQEGRTERTVRPVGELLEERRRQGGEVAWFHTCERFADVFATYALGPAYAYCYLFLGLDPNQSDDQTHPSSSERSYTVLRTLKHTIGDHLTDLGSLLDDLDVLSRPINSPRNIPRGDGWGGSQVVSDCDVFLHWLERLAPRARYETLGRAFRLVGLLRGDSGTTLDLPPGASVLDVLNAAWLLRSQKPIQPSLTPIGHRAIVLCRQALGEPGLQRDLQKDERRVRRDGV